MKHKHAEVIKAWADGAEIECRSILNGEWGVWRLVQNSTFQPYQWNEKTRDLRVKPVFPTLGEIAKVGFGSGLSTKPTKDLWEASAAAVKAAIESGEYNGSV